MIAAGSAWAAATITGAKIKDGSVRSIDVANNGIQSPGIKAGSVNKAKLAANARPTTELSTRLDLLSPAQTAWVTLVQVKNLNIEGRCVDAGGGIMESHLRMVWMADNAKMVWTTILSNSDTNNFTYESEDVDTGLGITLGYSVMMQGNAHYVGSAGTVNVRYFSDGGTQCLIYGVVDAFNVPDQVT